MTRTHEGFERPALGRAGERLEAALQATDALGRALDAESDPAGRAALLREYEGARRQAALARTMLLIQREAIGQFPEPPRRS